MPQNRLTQLEIQRRINRRIDAPNAAANGNVCYSIATLMNDPAQLEAMHDSMRAGGFDGPDCEFLWIDNTGHAGQTIGAYAGINAMLNEARGDYVIACHQDIRLLTQTRENLDRRLAELDSLDADWALAGNAGGVAPGKLAIRITDPHGANQYIGTLPARVASLDENFIVIRRNSRIGCSNDLDGFHFYGADLCLNAATAGWTSYVIDFHLAHLSAGKKGDTFETMQEAFRAKWSRAFAPRWIQTTCALIHLSAGPVSQFAGRIAHAPYHKIVRRIPGASGWNRSNKKEIVR